MLRALDEYEIGGVETLLGFHRALLRQPCFVEAGTCHGVVESEELAEEAKLLSHQTTIVPGSPDGAVRATVVPVELDGRRFDVRLSRRASACRARTRKPRSRPGPRRRPRRARTPSSARCRGRSCTSASARATRSLPATSVCIVEAMKMENEIAAHRPGLVTALSVAAGEPVTLGQVICIVEGDGETGSE